MFNFGIGEETRVHIEENARVKVERRILNLIKVGGRGRVGSGCSVCSGAPD